VNAYFGLDGENGVTIEQIGQKYDLTKERIRQIKERAIKRLQKARYSNALKAYLGYYSHYWAEWEEIRHDD
jgi:RNA polymerase primary sigma factor